VRPVARPDAGGCAEEQPDAHRDRNIVDFVDFSVLVWKIQAEAKETGWAIICSTSSSRKQPVEGIGRDGEAGGNAAEWGARCLRPRSTLQADPDRSTGQEQNIEDRFCGKS